MSTRTEDLSGGSPAEAERQRAPADPEPIVQYGVGSFAVGLGMAALGTMGGDDLGGDDLAVLGLHAGILTVVTLLVFGQVVRPAMSNTGRPMGRAGWLAGIGVVSVVAYYSGLPVVLGTAAALIATRARARLEPQQRGRRAGTIIAAVGVTAVGLGIVASVSDALTDDPSGNRVSIGMTEYAFDAPAEIKGGVVEIELSNEGAELHDLTIARIADGHTLAELRDALADGGPPDWVQAVGASHPLSPGHELTMTQELRPGRYALICSLPTSDLQSVHALEGMLSELTVAGERAGDLPEPDMVIVATDDGYRVPQRVEAGRQLIEFRNDGRRPHEFPLLAIEPGKTFDDVNAWFEGGMKGRPPATFLGGSVGIDPGQSVLREVVLEQGTEYSLDDAEGGFRASFKAL